ncbi:MAG: HAMP domain-containing histidine kinase [Bacteroidaceae bacterium]|nr:HAMP domain-containing histidine kinase [Bacteroidaceae bacterium]
MKLIYRVTLRLAIILIPIIASWGVIFYYTMVAEINDESDDSLVEYAEKIVRCHLSGRPMPALNNGSNNSYTIVQLDSATVVEPYMTFHDEMVYIPEQEDTEPARVLTTVFMDSEERQYRLQVAMPTFERDDLIRAIFWYIVVLYFLLLITILVTTTIIFYNNIKPLYRLLAWFDSYIPGKKQEPAPDSTVVEFHKLALAAQRAVDRAELYLEQQKQFIGNASHELQTPLAVIGNRIEWLIDSTALQEEQYVELSKIRHTLSGMVRLNRTLLLLTKIDNGLFPEVSQVDISGLLRNELEMLVEVYDYKNIDSKVDAPDFFFININESLAKILIGNLVKNAYVHSAPGTSLNIVLDKRHFAVSNSGDAPLDEKYIFNRFYHKGAQNSTGLGLALVKSICRYYNFKVYYSYGNGMHSFVVEW